MNNSQKFFIVHLALISVGLSPTTYAQTDPGQAGDKTKSESIPPEAMDRLMRELDEDDYMYGLLKDPGQTWIETEGQVYGAKPDDRGPIGGGTGYKRIIGFDDADYYVWDLDDLLDVLKQATKGQIIFIDGKACLDCTTLVYIEEMVLNIPEGVTLASDRGRDGSKGALILSDALKTNPLIQAKGPGVRITGLRIRGPNPRRRFYHHRRSFDEGRGHEYYYKFPQSVGIQADQDRLEVDNCELAGWSLAAINLCGGKRHHAHHNYIHHNQDSGLGYGLCLDQSEILIEQNLFDFNKHTIAGTGLPGTSYEACNNVELGAADRHCFDMHLNTDPQTEKAIGGTWIKIHHNTFRADKTPVGISGPPQEQCRVYHNWFLNHQPKGEAQAVNGKGNMIVENNWYGDAQNGKPE